MLNKIMYIKYNVKNGRPYVKFEVCLLQYIRLYFLLHIIRRLLLQLPNRYASVDSLVGLAL